MTDAQCRGIRGEEVITILAEIDHGGAGRQPLRDRCDIAQELADQNAPAVVQRDRTVGSRGRQQREMLAHCQRLKIIDVLTPPNAKLLFMT